jgi:hypothetical protein
MELAVGDSTEIALIFNSKGFKGKVQKGAGITTNDTTATGLYISLTGEVTNSDSTFPLLILPPHLDFTPFFKEKVMVKKTGIKNVSHKEIKLKIIDSPTGYLEVRLSSENIKPSKEIELVAKLNSKLKEDSFNKSITLELNDKNKTRFTIPVKRDAKVQ